MEASADTMKDGVCQIKAEFVLANHCRSVAVEHISRQDQEKLTHNGENDEKSETKDAYQTKEDGSKRQKLSTNKLKGQNRQRDVTYSEKRSVQFCRHCINTLPVAKCSDPRCQQMHDVQKFLESKPPNIEEECPVFKLRGYCPAGITCRFGGHIGEGGKNIIDEDKKNAVLLDKTLQNLNALPHDTQKLLWKKNYSFEKSEKAVTSAELYWSKEAKDRESGEHLYGAIDDTDLIKWRVEERKKLDWRGKLYLSPLTTVGNLPFRRICVEYGADITCGEMMLALPIIQAKREWVLARRHPSEKIFGVQICGKAPTLMAKAAQVIEENAEVDFIDINMGCPIDSLYQQGCGSGLMGRKKLASLVASSMSNVMNIPLTVKMRMGVSSGSPIAHDLLPLMRSSGVSLATVHGRSREQRYTKLADWAYIDRCAKVASPMPVFGNGDILSYDDYKSYLEQSPNVTGAMIGRGALIKPWIFKEIKENRDIDMSSSERLDMLRRFVYYGLDHWGSDTRGVETTRRFLLEWLSFLHRYVPTGLLVSPPQRINQRPPAYSGRDEMETLMASSSCADWVRISEMLLGKVPDEFQFLPKHKANAWK